jgi:hypothetical protein
MDWRYNLLNAGLIMASHFLENTSSTYRNPNISCLSVDLSDETKMQKVEFSFILEER